MAQPDLFLGEGGGGGGEGRGEHPLLGSVFLENILLLKMKILAAPFQSDIILVGIVP